MSKIKDDIRDVLKEVGVVTKENIGVALKEYGVVTKENIGVALKEYGVVTEKKMKSELNKVKKELQTSIANVAFSSPTINQFSNLEKRVEHLESFKTS